MTVLSRCTLGFLLACLAASVVSASSDSRSKTKRPPTKFETTFDQLANLRANTSFVSSVQNLTIKRGAGVFHLQEGTVSICSTINDSTRAIVFKGSARFRFAPPTDLEREQVKRIFEMEPLDIPVTELLIVFTDTTLRELTSRCSFGPSPDDAEQLSKTIPALLSIHLDADEHRAAPAMLKALMEEMNTGYFSAAIRPASGKLLMFVIDPFEEEEISLWQGESTLLGRRFPPEIVSQFRAPQPMRIKKEYLSIDAYTIRSSFSGSLEYRGCSSFAIRANEPGHTWAPFILTHLLNIDSIVTADGTLLDWFRGEDNNTLWLNLPKTLASGGADTLFLYSHGDLILTESGLAALRTSTLWYPRLRVNDASLRASALFDLTFSYPDSYELVSVGKRQSSVVREEVRTDRWVTQYPIRNASFSIGKYNEFRLQEPDAPPIKVFATANAEHGMEKEVAFDLLNSVRFFQTVFGPCPVDSLYAAEVPSYGGEAFAGFVHLSIMTFLESTTASAVESDVLLRAHEVAHQWWGIALDFRSYHDQWLSEGFAQYAGLWYAQARLKDNERFFKPLLRWKSDLLTARKYLFTSGQPLGPVALGYRNESRETEGDHARITYEKSAWVLHMLRTLCIDLKTMRDDRFIAILQEFYSTYKGKRATTRDFQRLAERIVGQDLSWFFNQWVYGTEIPTYSVETDDPVLKDGKYEVTMRVVAEGVSDGFIAPVIVLFDYGENRYSRARIVIKGKETTVTIPGLPLEPQEVKFNDIESVLCEVD